MPVFDTAKANSERFGPSRSASTPPSRLPTPSPARKADTTVVIETRSTPACREMTRCHTTWRVRAEKPVTAKMAYSAARWRAGTTDGSVERLVGHEERQEGHR